MPRCLKEVSLSPDHPLLEMADGVLFRKDTRTLLWYPVSRKGNDYAVPEGTKRIGRYSLYHAKTESIILPDSVEELPEGAFDSCTRLRIVNIPPKVSTANRIFNACDKLESITVDEGNPSLEVIDGVLFDKSAHTLLKYPVKKSGKEYTVPEGTETIAGNAFESTLLETVVLPGSVRVIGSYTFFLCLRLKEIVLPEGTEELSDYAFQTCESLVKVSLPESLSKVGTNPFLKCKKLQEIVVAEGNQALALVSGCLVRKEDMAVVACPPGTKEKKLEFPAGIRKVDSLAFDSCTGVEEIVFGEGLEEIADRAFRGCKKLRRVVLPASLTLIDPTAFPAGDLKKAVFVVTPGSYAESFCTANGLKIEYAE